MSTGGKRKFVMKHVYTAVRNLGTGEWYRKEEEHSGVAWAIIFLRDPDNFWLGLRNKRVGSDEEWTMDVTIDAILKTITGEEVIVKNYKLSNGYVINGYFKQQQPLENYVVDGSFSVEFHVTINKITGIEEFPRMILRSFDESTERFSDVVLVLQDQKFYINRKYLASHSPYFDALLLGNFDESKQSEVELKDIDPWDFQIFLELIHGEPAVHECSVEGILKLADMYDSKTAIRQCEKFLLNDSKQGLKVKFQLAVQYKLEKLKDKCMSEIKTINDIKSVVPENASNLNPDVWKELLNRSIDLYDKK